MKYGFIGCGNMGGAIARAMARKTKDLALSDRSGKAKALAADLGVTYTDNATIAAQAEYIFLGVKPFMMAGVLEPLKEILAQRRPVLVTMAAGLTLDTIAEFTGTQLPVVRIMPNTPTAICRGVIQYCRNGLVTDEMLETLLKDMAPCGLLDHLEENLIDAASALSGSGPAYLYVMLEALADGAVACGVPRAKAMEYAAMTMVGAGELYLQTHTHPGALKDAVCSPKGSTIAGIRALEQHGFRGAVMDCVMATYARNKEVAKEK